MGEIAQMKGGLQMPYCFINFGLIADFLEELLVQNTETASHSTLTILKIWEHLILHPFQAQTED